MLQGEQIAELAARSGRHRLRRAPETMLREKMAAIFSLGKNGKSSLSSVVFHSEPSYSAQTQHLLWLESESCATTVLT